jgi:hypothetical protein
VFLFCRGKVVILLEFFLCFVISLTLKLAVTTNNPHIFWHLILAVIIVFVSVFFSFPPFVLSFSSHRGTLPSFAEEIFNSHAKVFEIWKHFNSILVSLFIIIIFFPLFCFLFLKFPYQLCFYVLFLLPIYIMHCYYWFN